MNSIDNLSFKLPFKILCVIVVLFMVGFWFYKFGIEDRDIGVVDYVKFGQQSDVPYPVVSLCFDDPILRQKLMRYNDNVNASSYLHYLKGHIFEERLDEIEYSNVSIDLNEYFFTGQALWSNETLIPQSLFQVNHTENFNGFHGGGFFQMF